MHNMTVTVYDQNNRAWKLYDAKDITMSGNMHGYDMLTIPIQRKWSTSYRDFALGNNVIVQDDFNDTVFDGRLETTEFTYNNGKADISLGVSGFQSTVSDLNIVAGLSATITSASVESQVNTMVTGGLMPEISLVMGDTVTSGRTNQSYALTNNTNQPNYRNIDDLLNDILRDGMSDGRPIAWQIWNNRTMNLYAVPLTGVTPRYEVKLADLDRITIRQNLLSVYDSMLVMYKDASTIYQSSSQVFGINGVANRTKFGKTYASGFVNYRRQKILDVSNLPNINTLALANAVANANVDRYTNLKNDSRSLVLKPNARVLDLTTNTYIAPYRVKTGVYIRVADLFPRTSGSNATGTLAGDGTRQNTFLITAWSYDQTSKKTSIVPENSTSLNDVIQ